MVEVFTTDVHHEEHAQQILEGLQLLLPDCKINFDLDDCDKILRVSGRSICIELIIEHLRKFGHQCRLLE